jgi:sugar lactone lactonase YvrE
MTKRLFAALALAAVVGTSPRAATPTFWMVSTQGELLRGEAENLSIDVHGRMFLGPATELVYESTTPFLWTLVSGPDGSIYAGSGNEGKVFKVDPSGRGTVFFDAAELEVHALAIAPDGTLFVGSSPDGKVYKVGADGESAVFFDPEDRYIWALGLDRKGQLFVATGEKGAVYRVGADGKGEVFYRAKATHTVALAFDRAGELVIGTESPGQVLRVDAQGRPFVLLDSPFQEIHSLRLDERGAVFATAVNGQRGAEDRPAIERPAPDTTRSSTPVATVTTEVTSMAIVDVSVPSVPQVGPPPREDRRTPKGAVYRIHPDGQWDAIWESREDSPYDVSFDGDGSLLIATGAEGKIFSVAGEPTRPALLTRAAAQQVTMFLRDGKGARYYATANPGKLFRLSAGYAPRGTYESEVRDAETVANWGTISWRSSTPANSRIEISTRSGNTKVPDETWSPWSAIYADADGSQIASPKARYLQWRATLVGQGETPVLTSVTAAYLQRNIRPELSSITVHPPGTVFQKPFSTGELEIAGYGDTPTDRRPSSTATSQNQMTGGSAPALGRRIYQKGLQTFVWKAEDSNSDEMLYDVLYRREGETTWKPLKRGLHDPIVVWDTTSVPNGTYLVKVVASDNPSNPPGTALAGEMESIAFDIDNAPPAIEVMGLRREGTRSVLSFDVKDDQSAVQRVEFSLDADRWRTIYPKDGISDSRAEQFELLIDADLADKGVILRAVDAMNNVATARGEVTPARSQ